MQYYRSRTTQKKYEFSFSVALRFKRDAVWYITIVPLCLIAPISNRCSDIASSSNFKLQDVTTRIKDNHDGAIPFDFSTRIAQWLFSSHI